MKLKMNQQPLIQRNRAAQGLEDLVRDFGNLWNKRKLRKANYHVRYNFSDLVTIIATILVAANMFYFGILIF